MTKTKPAPQQSPSQSPEATFDDGLPTEPTKQVVNPLSLRYLGIAPPGWGKTEFFAQFPGSLMLACEEGHKFVEGFKIIIDSWADEKKWSRSRR